MKYVWLVEDDSDLYIPQTVAVFTNASAARAWARKWEDKFLYRPIVRKVEVHTTSDSRGGYRQ